MKYAIFTSTVNQDFFSLIQQKYIDYSKKCNADLIIRQTQHLQNYNTNLTATFERYDIYNLLKVYDRVLWLDSDIYITKVAKNIFDQVPEDEFGVYFEPDVIDKFNCVKRITETTGETLPSSRYFNSGVMVVSKEHAEIFNMDKANAYFSQPHIKICHNSDQDYLNILVYKNNIKVHALPSSFNHMMKWFKINNDEKLNFIHFNGYNPKKLFIQQFLKGNPNL